MMIKDDRNEKQKDDLPWLVVGTDPFMSGWGEAKNGVSYAAWSCNQETLNDTLCWVENRGDMKRIRVIYGDYKPKRSGHLHIYIGPYNKEKTK